MSAVGGALLFGLGMGLGTQPVGAAEDGRRWIPADTRVVLLVDPARAEAQPKARAALGVDALLGRLAARELPAGQVRAITLAFVPVEAEPEPVALFVGQGSLAKSFTRLRGTQMDAAGGKPIYGRAGGDAGALALPSPACILEGTHAAVRSLLQRTVAETRTLVGVPPEHAAGRLLGSTTQPGAVSLVYLAPGDGSDLFAVIQDLDRILGSEMTSTFAPYQKPLQVLGPTQGLRVDLLQEGDELATTLRLLMPNRMAAQIASVSLVAGKEMARAASDAAVRAGTMSRQDALVLAGALETLQAQADGDLVRVDVRVPDGVASGGARR